MRSTFKKVFIYHLKPLLLLTLTWGVYFFRVFSQALFIKNGNLYGGHVYIWGDWSLHIGMAQIFATKPFSEWFLYHPFYAGGKFTYGFLANLVSGVLMRAGFSLTSSFIIPSILCSLLLIFGMYTLFFIITRSKAASVVAIYIFFLSSGLGFTKFLTEYFSDFKIDRLFYPPIEYSRITSMDWYMGNYVVGMLVPQRAFLLGLTLAIWSLVFLLAGLKLSGKTSLIFLLVGGALAGILPITHMHSFIAVLVVCCFISVCFIRQWKKLALFALPAAVLSLILYGFFIYGGIENPNFMIWEPGFSSGGGFLAWLNMWWMFWGAALPFGCIYYIFLQRNLSKELKAFLAAALVLFVLSNLFRFQPIRWDNSKMFLWVYLILSMLLAQGIVWFWSKSFLSKVTGIAVFLLLTLTGCLELVRLARVDKNSHLMISSKDIQLAKTIREGTLGTAVFATAPTHNHLIMMWSARPVLMGYPGWVWNYGFLYEEREKDLATIFSGGEASDKLLRKYNVSYLFIGPLEKSEYHPNTQSFLDKFPVVFSDQDILVFDVRGLGGYR